MFHGYLKEKNLISSPQWTQDVVTEPVNCKERNRTPQGNSNLNNWVNFSQRSSPGPPFIPPQHPENLLLWGDRLCCLAAVRKRQAKAFFLAEKSALKNLWEHWKNTHGAGRCGGGSGFLPFWLGFILPSRKRNMHRAFHIKSVCPQAEHHSGLQSQTSPRNTYTTTEPEERCIQRDRSCHIKKKYILAH